MHPDYGIGPWAFQQLDAGNAQDFHEYGLPVERLWRGACPIPSPLTT